MDERVKHLKAELARLESIDLTGEKEDHDHNDDAYLGAAGGSSSSSSSSSFSSSSSSRSRHAPVSALAAIADAHKHNNIKVEKAQQERDDAQSSEEMLNTMVGPLEQMRREMKTVLLATRSAMLRAGLPSKQKNDDNVPTYFQANSWARLQQTPWNDAAKRAMTPAEGFGWFASRVAELEAENAELKRRR